MTLQTIYIARHGFRSNWLPPPHPPNPTGIDSDPALAPHGVDQAVELGEYLATLPKDKQPQFIISSPFYRCVESARPFAEKSGLKVHLDRGIGEWFKKDRGVVPVPADYKKLGEFFAEVLGEPTTWDSESGVVPSSQGESEEDVLERSHKFWKAFIPAFEKKHPEVTRLLLVNHAATKIALGMALLGHESLYDEIDFKGTKTRLRAGACSLDKFEREDNHWVLLENGKTDFLKDGEEMNWNFDVKVEAGSDEDMKRRAEEAKQKQGSENPTKPEKEPLEFEDVYVAVDVPIVAPSYYDESGDSRDIGESLFINPNAKFQLAGVEEERPLFKISENMVAGADSESASFSNSNAIDGQIYQARWRKLLGTELVFDDDGAVIGTVREHLVAEPSNKARKKPSASAGDKSDAMDVDSEAGEKADMRTTFLKTAVAAARSKAAAE
ncbi:uncharacterized protein CXQ87_005172 [Candidozyma duobushaemuli]|uniref:Transcription factor TFIIIC triple barrel domain-containing protein n=2 Tax=Candidozyma TaxID=3303203 RepID=A0ABX8IAE7_9ASCO|nr:uncharacterized protein CXQ87_005172 [[Candida] duobushaemulonis]PVH14896.1 hypothetical protein CXQ87_005172 [[Candida] duobushaemulonis]QWU90022.1 hypothetical protein CA3LBN_004380 [[Candida] haemuloni]